MPELLPNWTKDLLGGIVGGVGQCLVGHPLDTLKVRLQTQPQGAEKLYSGFIDCFRKTLRMEGIGGLYKGVGSPLTGTAALVGVKFFSFGKSKAFISSMNENPSQLKLWQFFASGSLAGFFTAFVEGPVDFFKSQMQVQIFKQQQQERLRKQQAMSSTQSSTMRAASETTVRTFTTTASSTATAKSEEILYRNVFHCGRVIIQQFGIKGAYQGLLATILRNIQGNAWFFGFAEVTRRALTPKGKTSADLGVFHQFLAGGIGGIFYWLLAFPFDVMKSSIQGDSPMKEHKKYFGYLDCARKLHQEGGAARFYKGFVPCMIRSFPANSAAFGCWFVVSQKLLKDY